MSLYNRQQLKYKIREKKIRMYYSIWGYNSIYFLPHLRYRRREELISIKLRHESIILSLNRYKIIENYGYKCSNYRIKFRDSQQDWSQSPKKMNRLFYKKQTRQLLKEYFEYVK